MLVLLLAVLFRPFLSFVVSVRSLEASDAVYSRSKACFRCLIRDVFIAIICPEVRSWGTGKHVTVMVNYFTRSRWIYCAQSRDIVSPRWNMVDKAKKEEPCKKREVNGHHLQIVPIVASI